MALSAGLTAKLTKSIDAVEGWRAAKEESIRADAAFLTSIQVGVEPVVRDVVEVAVDDAARLVAEVLAE
jgi:hypothetical protein